MLVAIPLALSLAAGDGERAGHVRAAVGVGVATSGIAVEASIEGERWLSERVGWGVRGVVAADGALFGVAHGVVAVEPYVLFVRPIGRAAYVTANVGLGAGWLQRSESHGLLSGRTPDVANEVTVTVHSTAGVVWRPRGLEIGLYARLRAHPRAVSVAPVLGIGGHWR